MARSVFRAVLSVLLVAATCAACREQRTSPQPQSPQSPAPPGTPSPNQPVTGSERIAWEQELLSGTDPNDYRFTAFIDRSGVVPLPDATCSRSVAGLACVAPLPPLSEGRHTIVLYASRTDGDRVFYSRASAEIVVTKTNRAQSEARPSEAKPGGTASDEARPGEATTGAAPPAPPPAESTPIDIVGAGLGPVSDLAVVRDGRVFVAERTGRVHVADARGLIATPALVLSDLPAGAAHGLFSLAPHPDFARNRFLFFAYSTETSNGPAYRIVRGRELDGRVAQLAVIREVPLDGEPRWAVIRFGPDGRLYLAATLADERQQPPVVSNVLLRLADDGSVPGDSADASAIVRHGKGVATGIAWSASGELLIQERAEAHAWLSTGDRRERDPRPRVAWGIGVRPAGLAMEGSARGSDGGGRLLVAMLDGGVQAVRLGESSATTASGARHGRQFGAIRAIAVAFDGTVFAGTANRDQLAPGSAVAKDLPRQDFLLRFSLPRSVTQ